jgi:hypothetical protein
MSASDDKRDEANAEDLLQPERIRHSELVTTEHAAHSGMLYRQRDYSVGQTAVSAAG